jgi:hypothetical protein
MLRSTMSGETMSMDKWMNDSISHRHSLLAFMEFVENLSVIEKFSDFFFAENFKIQP